MQTQPIILNSRYKLLERIGSGGMSIVYKAQDLSLGRMVAVKMLHESLTGDADFLRRFRQEAHSAANLTHPNIVTVHDIGQDGHRYYMVMEYVEGQTLKQIIRENNTKERLMSVDRALDLTVQICNGIGYAHRSGLVHCDVKPQNVLVTRDDRVKVADFGIARAISEASQAYQNNQVWGTPQYFAPEQAAGQPATPASDVYSIGVIMFEELTGKLPFQAETQTALALKHLNEQPPLVTDYNPVVPEQLELIIDKVLSKDPAGRYRTAGQLGRILTTYRHRSQEETGIVYPPLTPEATIDAPIAEQQTQIYPHPYPDGQTGGSTPIHPQSARPGTAVEEAQTEIYGGEAGTDWVAVALGISAVIALLGLIPLWFFVYRAYVG